MNAVRPCVGFMSQVDARSLRLLLDRGCSVRRIRQAKADVVNHAMLAESGRLSINTRNRSKDHDGVDRPQESAVLSASTRTVRPPTSQSSPSCNVLQRLEHRKPRRPSPSASFGVVVTHYGLVNRNVCRHVPSAKCSVIAAPDAPK